MADCEAGFDDSAMVDGRREGVGGFLRIQKTVSARAGSFGGD